MCHTFSIYISQEMFVGITLSDTLIRGVKNAYTGYNIDWEPDEDATVQDGIDFSQFLDKFAIALHGKNMKLSVDVGEYNVNI